MVVVNKMHKKSVSKFLEQFRSQGTAKNYKSILGQFFRFIYPELAEITDPDEFRILMDEMSINYIKDLDRDYEQDIIRFRDGVLKDLAPSTQGFRFTVIFRYLKVNDLEFDSQWKKNIVGSKEKISKERVPEPEELRKIVYHLPVQGKAYILVLATSGMRMDEGLQLKISDLELDYVAKYLGEDRQMKSVSIPKINIRAETTKTKKGRVAFITTEAKIELERWLAYRGEYVEGLKRRGIPKRFERTIEEGKLFPFGEATARSMWETALRKVGLYERDERTGRLTLRLHNLRKFFRTWGGWSNPDVAQCLMGHQQGLNAIYARPDQALRLLVEGYKEAEANLTLSEAPVIEQVPSEDLRELRDWNRQIRLEILEEKEKRRELKEMVESWKEFAGDIAERLGRLETFVESLGYEYPRGDEGEVKYDEEKDERME